MLEDGEAAYVFEPMEKADQHVSEPMEKAERETLELLEKTQLVQLGRQAAEHSAHHRDVQQALVRYYKVTGFLETNIAAIHHHVISQYGPPCGTCGKPLRTPRAKMCAACGTTIVP